MYKSGKAGIVHILDVHDIDVISYEGCLQKPF